MKKILLALALLLAPSLAWAQCNGIFPANTLCGNLTGSPAPPGPFTASGTIVGPATSTLHGLPYWGNTLGTQLLDAAGNTIAGNYTWSGTDTWNGNQTWTGANSFTTGTTTFSGTANFTGTFQVGTQTFTWPAAGTGVAGTGTNNTLSGNNTFTGNNTFSTGTDNFTGTFQIGGTTLTLPVSVPNGGTGVATLTNHGVLIGQAATPVGATSPGTLGQSLTSNGASADPTFKSGGWTLLNTLTASNSVSLSDTSSITTSYSNYMLVFTQFIPATNGAVLTLQVHSGGAFKNTGYLNSGGAIIANAFNGYADVTTAGVQLSYDGATNATSNAKNATTGINGTVTLFGPGSSQISPWNSFISYLRAANDAVVMASGTGIWNTSGAIDGFQVQFNTGNITSGTIKIYGQL